MCNLLATDICIFSVASLIDKISIILANVSMQINSKRAYHGKRKYKENLDEAS